MKKNRQTLFKYIQATQEKNEKIAKNLNETKNA